MTIELTPEQHKALAGQTEEPKRIIDRQTGATYVLVPAEDYERVREILEDDRQRKAISTVALQNAERRMMETDDETG